MLIIKNIGKGFVRAPVCGLCCLLMSIILFPGIAAAGIAPIEYSLTDLGTPAEGTSIATGLNNSGQLVGYVYYGGRGGSATQTHAFLYDGATFHELGTLGAADSEAHGINSSGQIVGDLTLANGNTHAFLYSNGNVNDLGTLPGTTSSSATGINDSGQIVGSSKASGGVSHAFLYSGGSMHDLGTLGGSRSSATAINYSGQITGNSTTAGDRSQFAFLYSNGKMQSLGDLGPDSGTSSGTAINNKGEITGLALTSQPQFHVFLYRDGAMHDLGTPLGGSDSVGTAINDNGEIIGSSTLGTPPNETFPVFLYTGGAAYDLNSLVINEGAYHIRNVVAINDKGQIAATADMATQERDVAVLLTPVVTTAVPLPPAAWAALTALPLLLLGRRVIAPRH